MLPARPGRQANSPTKYFVESTGAADIPHNMVPQQRTRGECPRELAQLRGIIRCAGFAGSVPLYRDSAGRAVAPALCILAD